jgi:queuine tRNA-ribosyltransferase
MFKIIKESNKSKARRGLLKTAHGKIATPFFMPVATQGVVKQLTASEVKALGAPIILANTYHLMLRPGVELIKKAGGLHEFMNWPGTILTDSGGFQIFSLAGERGADNLVKLTNRGVEFKSYLDGSRHFLTPEKALQIQTDMGVDIAVCLDECVALPAAKTYLAKAVDLTTDWARRTKIYAAKIKKNKPLIFAVIQGGLDKKLRLKSLATLTRLDFDGYNIGGLSVGETPLQMYKVLDYLVPIMPETKPRYLMGVGYPENILEAVKRGMDMFDCVIPTREGRHGRLFRFKPNADKLIAAALAGSKAANFYEEININNAKFSRDFKPINPTSAFKDLTNLSLAYLHHLFKVREPLGQRLATLNNLEFYLRLMEKIRKSI